MDVVVIQPNSHMDLSAVSKKRRRSIEPIDTAKILAMPLALSPRSMKDDDSASDEDVVKESEASQRLRRSLMGLSLQLKLKMMLVEAWASDMNNVVMERNLFAIAKELALLNEMGVYEEQTCVRFLELARARMVHLLSQSERRETLQMEAPQMWAMAQIQAHEKVMSAAAPLSPTDSDRDSAEFPSLPGYDAVSRDISVLWKAMSIAKERGAQLWHENRHEQALPFLLAADSYMKRFTLKYQRLKIDQAMLDTFQKFSATSLATPESPKRKQRNNHVKFADEPLVMGQADPDVDRSPICPTKPSKLESLLLRTSREFPTPRF